MKWTFLALSLCATPAVAQEFDKPAMLADLRACYGVVDTYEGKTACRNGISTLCMEETDGGHSTLGMSMCTNAETEAWDVLLNEEYKTTMAAFRDLDAENAVYFPNLDTREETMLTAQRAWIVYRDAECHNEYALWGSGSMRSLIGAACLLDFTAERTIEIWAKREMY